MRALSGAAAIALPTRDEALLSGVLRPDAESSSRAPPAPYGTPAIDMRVTSRLRSATLPA